MGSKNKKSGTGRSAGKEQQGSAVVQGAKVLKKKSEVEEEKLGSKTTALPLRKKSISGEIDEIFGNKKRKVVVAESGDSVQGAKVSKKKSEVEEEKLGSKTTALPLRKKSISGEIDEIFGNKKRKVVVAESGDSAVATQGKKTKGKGAEVTVHGQRSSDKSPSASREKPTKKTLDGFTVYSEDEIGWNKKNAGGTALCPFDCVCCF